MKLDPNTYYGPIGRLSWRTRIRALGHWRTVHMRGAWDYQHNTVTGQRRAVRVCEGGWCPIETEWLLGAPWPHREMKDKV